METIACCTILPIVWLLFGVITASTESGRGRSGMLGFVLGCLLGPIALVFSLCMPEERKKCPYCSNSVKYDANVCMYCGRELPK